MQLLKQALNVELQRGIHELYLPNPAQTLRIMSLIVRLMRIIVKKRQNMSPSCHSTCLPADQEASMLLALLWPVKPLCTGPGLVCEDTAKLGSGTAK